MWHWRTWSTVCSAPHSQAAEEAIPHLYKQQRKRPTQVLRRLSRTQALPGRVAPRGWVPCAARILLSDNWWVVRRVQMGILIWGAVHLHSMDGWTLTSGQQTMGQSLRFLNCYSSTDVTSVVVKINPNIPLYERQWFMVEKVPLFHFGKDWRK